MIVLNITLASLNLLVVVLISVLSVYGLMVSSSTNSVFSPYNDTITPLSLTELNRSPKKSDKQSLYDLFHYDDSVHGEIVMETFHIMINTPFLQDRRIVWLHQPEVI